MASSVNDKLRELYREAWKQLEGLNLPKDRTFSMPFFIEALPEYEAAPLKLMIVGQQPRGWGDGTRGETIPDDPIAALQAKYHRAICGYRKGHFVRMAVRLQKALSPRVPPNGFVWANVFPMDQNLGQPELALQQRLLDLKLLAGEIRILQPHAVVFFVGPYYGKALSTLFGSAELTQPSKDVPLTQIRGHDLLPEHSYWTYHPRSLHFQGRAASILVELQKRLS